MKLNSITIQNFRSYRNEVTIDFDDITALIGRNDAGKSTIMEALDIFLNNNNPDKHDVSSGNGSAHIKITCTFSDLPETIILDQNQPTSFESEFLLFNRLLKIEKVFNGGLEKPKLIALNILANHPNNPELSNLHKLNNNELKQKARELNLNLTQIDQRVNSELRNLIRSEFSPHTLVQERLSLLEGNGQNFWQGIQQYLPIFALFKSDRASTDQDPEAQDPLNTAIKEAVRVREAELNAITEYIKAEVDNVARLTLQKIQEMDRGLASTLNPTFTPPKWATLFKASITGDEGIPINKRGSGVRRLILLNFFRAKAELQNRETGRNYTILAIEEPETSQHPHNQRLLMGALTELSGNHQVIVTTHTPVLAKMLPSPSIRFITTAENGERVIMTGGSDETNQLIADGLGIIPDHTVKMFIGVEGKHDIPFFKNLSIVLINSGYDVPNLEQLEIDGKLIFTPLGGSALALWCSRLSNLNRPEFHIYDRDFQPSQPAKYQQFVDEVNQRPGCFACSTNKREAENYIHIDAINEALLENGINLRLPEQFDDFDDIPTRLSVAVNTVVPPSNKWGQGRAKEFIANSAIKKMNRERFEQMGSVEEIIGWFNTISEILSRS